MKNGPTISNFNTLGLVWVAFWRFCDSDVSGDCFYFDEEVYGAYEDFFFDLSGLPQRFRRRTRRRRSRKGNERTSSER